MDLIPTPPSSAVPSFPLAAPPAAPPAPPSRQRAAELVEAHMSLLRGVAGKLLRSGTAKNIDMEELVSVGALALLEAAGRFDPTAGVLFTTFAFPRIRGAMIDAIGKLAPLTRGAYRAAREREAAGEPGIFVHSLDQAFARGEEPAAETVDVPDAIDLDRHQRRLDDALAKLPARKRRFIDQHYFGGRDLKDIGGEFGLSKSWASRLHAQALVELRDALDPDAASTTLATRRAPAPSVGRRRAPRPRA